MSQPLPCRAIYEALDRLDDLWARKPRQAGDLAMVTPAMLEAGVRAFRRWDDEEGHTSHPDWAYPFDDEEVSRLVQAVFWAMTE